MWDHGAHPSVMAVVQVLLRSSSDSLDQLEQKAFDVKRKEEETSKKEVDEICEVKRSASGGCFKENGGGIDQAVQVGVAVYYQSKKAKRKLRHRAQYNPNPPLSPPLVSVVQWFSAVN